jgi:hypothetical protein
VRGLTIRPWAPVLAAITCGVLWGVQTLSLSGFISVTTVTFSMPSPVVLRHRGWPVAVGDRAALWPGPPGRRWAGGRSRRARRGDRSVAPVHRRRDRRAGRLCGAGSAAAQRLATERSGALFDHVPAVRRGGGGDRDRRPHQPVLTQAADPGRSDRLLIIAAVEMTAVPAPSWPGTTSSGWSIRVHVASSGRRLGSTYLHEGRRAQRGCRLPDPPQTGARVCRPPGGEAPITSKEGTHEAAAGY